MRRSERLRALLRIVERLAQDEWTKVDLVLGQFNGRRTDDWQGSKQSYIAWSLENVDDTLIQELGEFFGLTTEAKVAEHVELGVTAVAESERIWGATPSFRLFLSHVSQFKTEAASLKTALKTYGVSAFVAHSDIQPTKEWLDEILKALGTMDALAAMLVPTFHESNWTDQEVGFALGRNVPILPLKFSQDPYGFIGRFQALNCASLTAQQAASNVARLLIENPLSQSAMSDTVGRRLLRSGSFALSKTLMDLLEVPSTIPQSTLQLVSQANGTNDQVSQAWGVSDRIENLLRRHGFAEPLKTSTAEEIPF